MSKFSVKKPFTILVMVLIVIMLGVVSTTRMQMDLLPQISLPYVLVITTYPGASPEKVESAVAEPLESALGTVTGVENVTSYSYENYCMVQLEFADDIDMDSVMVKLSTAIDTVEEYFPEECGTPSIMELSVDMMASMYLAVAYDGQDIEQLSDFVESTIIPSFERQNGVASITSLGLVDQSIQIELDQEKVDALNDQILGIAEDAFAEAMEQLDEAREQLEEAEEQLASSRDQLEEAQQELNEGRDELANGQAEINSGREDIAEAQQELDDAQQQLTEGQELLEEKQDETYATLATASEMLEAYETYKAELVAQNATLTALDVAIAEVINNANKATNPSYASKSSYSDTEVTSFVNNSNTTITTLTASIGQLETAISTKAAIDAAIGVVNQADTDSSSISDNQVVLTAVSIVKINLDETSKAVLDYAVQSNDYDTVLLFLTPASDTLAAAISASPMTVDQLKTAKSGLETAVNYINTFKGEKATLQVQIATTKAIVEEYEKKLKEAGISYTSIEEAKLDAATEFANANTGIVTGQMQLDTAQAQLDAAEAQLDAAQTQLDTAEAQLDAGQQQIDDGWEQLEAGQQQIDDGWESYYDGLVQFDKQRREALRNANADQLLTLSTLSGIIYAQNFEMPAGYIDDEYDNSWLLKIGNNFDSIEDLENMVLCRIEDVGDVRLKDIANITIIDNADVTYTKLDSNDAVILSVFKSSTTGTNEVSKVCQAEIKRLEEQYPGLHIFVMTDQGDYIDIIVKNIAVNMLLGAALAIIVLAIFLKDFMPTIVVAISIPLSVLTAFVAMYFAGVSLNMMSLSGMALGIGMLVDNSIVVIENIYRLRGRGVEAPRAAVQGTKQVAGAVVASTLTTVCVFFPIVYTNGMTRELLLPMSLTIIFCLLASLLIAMTVVPASASTLLKNTKPKAHPWFDKIQDVYGKMLGFCLKVKIIPLFVAISLLVLSIWQVLRMGIVMIPEMTSNEMQASVTFAPETEREVAYEQMNIFLDRALQVEGVGTVGVFAGGSSSLFATGGDDDDYLSYSVMLTAENENAGAEEIKKITDDLYAATADLNMEINISSGMGDLSGMFGSGLSISIYGDDLDTLIAISNDVMEIIDSVEGFTEISNGQEDADQVLHLNIDKDYAMSLGLSVAQIYQGVAGKLTTTASSISVIIDGNEMDIELVDERDELTYENLMDYTIAVKVTDEDGDQVTEDIPLSDLAELVIEDGVSSINRRNQTRYITVSAMVEEGYNTTLLSRELTPLLESYATPDGYRIDLGGESESVNDMVQQMSLMMIMGLAFIYFVMVAQFQSLLSPFIVLFTVPLAFTGGLLALWFTGENLSVISFMGLVVLLGTVVNNGIVFVDYANQLRIGGMSRRDALIATGKTRMRPILMTAMTTILAESSLIFGDDMASQMGKGMALVIAGGLAYATLMTLFIIPVMYDILFKKAPLNVDTGSEDLDDVPDDAQEFMQSMLGTNIAEAMEPEVETGIEE